MNTNTTTSARKPTEQQTMLMRMAKKGTTRAAVREALQYDEGAKIPVQTMLKKVADRFDMTLVSEPNADRTVTYRMVAKVEKPHRKRRLEKAIHARVAKAAKKVA